MISAIDQAYDPAVDSVALRPAVLLDVAVTPLRLYPGPKQDNMRPDPTRFLGAGGIDLFGLRMNVLPSHQIKM